MSQGAPPRVGIYSRQSRNKTKSITEQTEAGRKVAAAEGWTVVGEYEDGSSASRYARKNREAWTRVLADIDAGRLDILCLWEASRGDRTLTTWSSLLDLCRDRGVSIYVISDERAYNPRKSSDWKSLARAGVDSAGESDQLSDRVRRGQEGAAAKGRPAHGRVPYGYRRRFDSDTGVLAGWEIDPKTAPVVRRIFADIARGVPVSRVTNALNDEGVPRIGSARTWYRQRIRDIVGNAAYIGLRAYNGVEYDGTWSPIVDKTTFYTAQRVLSEPARTTTKPGRARHLLSYLGVCDPCGAGLTAVRGRYRCSARGCVTVVQDDVDAYVTAFVVGRLSRPDVYQSLRRAGEDADQRVIAAEEEAAQLRRELDGWRESAADGKTSRESLAVIEARLAARIKDADARVKRYAVPPLLRTFLSPGEDVAARWESAPLAARRDLLRAFWEVRIGPATVPGSRLFEPERVQIIRKRGVR